jgi:hypothetical protein
MTLQILSDLILEMHLYLLKNFFDIFFNCYKHEKLCSLVCNDFGFAVFLKFWMYATTIDVVVLWIVYGHYFLVNIFTVFLLSSVINRGIL